MKTILGDSFFKYTKYSVWNGLRDNVKVLFVLITT